MEIDVVIKTDAARTMLNALNGRIDTAMRAAMVESNALLLGQVRDYPPPPARIQGPAVVPIRTFTTRSGQTVRMAANKASGKGIKMGKASSLYYKRTNTLYRSWHTILRGRGAELTGGVSSSGQIAPYNRYVQDEARQARIHQGRWDPAQDIGKRSEPRIQAIFRSRINALVATTQR